MIAGRHPHTALVNGRAIAVDPGETLLHAALRQGVAIPFSCRVGGCATCKCTLVEGRVKELTDAGYLLTDDELDRGVVLACQSVPHTDVRVEVDLARHGELRSVAGRVVGQRRLTHDITALRIQLDQGLPYRAGQSARVSLGIARSRPPVFVRHPGRGGRPGRVLRAQGERLSHAVARQPRGVRAGRGGDRGGHAAVVGGGG